MKTEYLSKILFELSEILEKISKVLNVLKKISIYSVRDLLTQKRKNCIYLLYQLIMRRDISIFLTHIFLVLILEKVASRVNP